MASLHLKERVRNKSHDNSYPTLRHFIQHLRSPSHNPICHSTHHSSTIISYTNAISLLPIISQDPLIPLSLPDPLSAPLWSTFLHNLRGLVQQVLPRISWWLEGEGAGAWGGGRCMEDRPLGKVCRTST